MSQLTSLLGLGPQEEPLEEQHWDPPISQKPQSQSMHIKVGEVWQKVFSGHAAQGLSRAVHPHSGVMNVPSGHSLGGQIVIQSGFAITSPTIGRAPSLPGLKNKFYE